MSPNDIFAKAAWSRFAYFKYTHIWLLQLLGHSAVVSAMLCTSFALAEQNVSQSESSIHLPQIV